MLLSVLPYLCTFAASKITFTAVFFIRYVCEYLIYRKTPKSVLFAVCSRLPSQMYVCAIFRFWYVCSRLFLFSFSLAFCFTKFVCETLCKFLYVYASLKCMFMQYVMINRKFGEFSNFSAPLRKRSIFLLFVFSLFLLFWLSRRKQKQKRKSRFLMCFCPKTSVFVANKTLIFSDLYLYRVIYTPPPRFWHSQGGSALIRNFLFFLFFIFC